MLDIAYRRLNLDFIKIFKKRKDKPKKEKIIRENDLSTNKEKDKNYKIISQEKKIIKEKLQEDIKVEEIKKKESKIAKSKVTNEENKKQSLDTSSLLKKKSDRKKI